MIRIADVMTVSSQEPDNQEVNFEDLYNTLIPALGEAEAQRAIAELYKSLSNFDLTFCPSPRGHYTDVYEDTVVKPPYLFKHTTRFECEGWPINRLIYRNRLSDIAYVPKNGFLYKFEFYETKVSNLSECINLNWFKRPELLTSNEWRTRRSVSTTPSGYLHEVKTLHWRLTEVTQYFMGINICHKF